MILKYGGYSHQIAETAIVISRTGLFSAGQQYGYRERWDVQGFLQAANQAALTAAIAALKVAYQLQGQDLGLYLDDGVTATAHVLRSSETIGGVRVIAGPSFPQGRGAEYSTFRSYALTIEADVADSSIGLLFWDEVLSFSGGGPRFVLMQTLNGLPQRQQVAQATPYLVTQSGRAVGRVAYPLPSTPLWPEAEHLDQRRITRRAPKRHGPTSVRSYTEYEINWEYHFESATSLTGNPRVWS